MTEILIGADHAGFSLKEEIKKGLTSYSWKDLGTHSPESVDYPDYAFHLANEIAQSDQSRGVLICGSGIGMVIAANKISGVRAALVDNPISARLCREHNDANVLCLASRFLASPYAMEITKIFLETPFSKEPRHQRRIDKIKPYGSTP